MFTVLWFVALIASVIDAEELQFNHMVPDTETSLTVEDFRLAKDLPNISPPNDSEMYYAHRFEGDIDDPYMTSAVASGVPMNASIGSAVYGNAIRDRRRRWPSGRVPYTISSQFNQKARATIAAAMEDYKKHTCIHWTPKSSSDNDYVHIVPGQGCGQQKLNLGQGCLYKGIIMHEMMHASGFQHEQCLSLFLRHQLKSL
ncbi:unnamed protein product [Anisakis simplex]|uniref:Metalloendopeptidase n=1 Tax=Anisakis simplex TaxID=6269 RepID=A0A0M3J179_ANISI|nr:unnamed protein product [Anisakis simplex]